MWVWLRLLLAANVLRVEAFPCEVFWRATWDWLYAASCGELCKDRTEMDACSSSIFLMLPNILVLERQKWYRKMSDINPQARKGSQKDGSFSVFTVRTFQLMHGLHGLHEVWLGYIYYIKKLITFLDSPLHKWHWDLWPQYFIVKEILLASHCRPCWVDETPIYPEILLGSTLQWG